MKEKIIIITGSPGTGKSTISREVTALSDAEKSAYIHTDDFYGYLVKGMIPPHEEGASEQNKIVMKACLSVVKEFAANGYHVIVDGIVGPWFLKPWEELVKEGYQVSYFVLRADKAETLRRATNRSKLTIEENRELVETMWQQFINFGDYEKYVIDTTALTVTETTAEVVKNSNNQQFFL